MTELVIFDCDGVLVDSERISHTVLVAMMQELGVALTLEQAIDAFMGTSTETCLRRVEELAGRPAPIDFMRRFGQRTFAAFADALTPVPGVAKLLSGLARPYCVASNGPRAKMTFTLGHTGLLPHFEGRLFSADDVPRPKPAPDLFLHAARTLGAEPPRCVVVEDSPTGVKAARAAGMTVYGFAAMTPESRLRDAGAHAVFSRMQDLPSLLGDTAR